MRDYRYKATVGQSDADRLASDISDQRFQRVVRKTPAGFRRRFAAGVIDMILYAGMVTLWSTVITVLAGYLPFTIDPEHAAPWWLEFVTVSTGWILSAFLAEVLIMLLFKRTLGKTIMGLGVMNASPDDWAVSTKQLITRTKYKALILVVFGINVPLVFESLIWSGSFFWVFGLLNVIVIYALSGLGSPDGQGLHDRKAGTVVVKL